MNTSKKMYLLLGSFLMLLFGVQDSMAQTFKVEKANSSLKIEGTSNLHDWEEEAEEFHGSLTAEIKDGQLVNITQLKLSVLAESLKSGKGGMDKNAYKALKIKNHKEITFELEKVTQIDCDANSSCKLTTKGYLTIAGTRKPVDLSLNSEMQQGKVVLTGSTDLKMTDYKVDPPTALLGTIKTGNEITVKYKITFNK